MQRSAQAQNSNEDNLVWCGTTAAMKGEVYSPERTTKLTNKAVSKMFKTFPVSKRKQYSPMGKRLVFITA